MSTVLVEYRKNDTVMVLTKISENREVLGEVEVKLGKLRHPIHSHRACPTMETDELAEAIVALEKLQAPTKDQTSKPTGSPKPSKVTKKPGRKGAKGGNGDGASAGSDSGVSSDGESADS